jgi:propionyl-CoA carboxylase alpha chain
MIAKVIAHGPTRAAAVRKLADALRRAELHGMTTNRDFLVNVLEHPEFAAGDADTSFLDRHNDAALTVPLDAADEDANSPRALAAAAAALALQHARRKAAHVLGSLPSGWRNVHAVPQTLTLTHTGGTQVVVTYRFDRSDRLIMLAVDGVPLVAPALHACDHDLVDLAIGGLRQRYAVHVDGDQVHVNTARAQSSFTVVSRHPRTDAGGPPAGSLTAPMPGSVLRVMTEVGAAVAAGQPLLVLEAMKMEHEIVAPSDGVVSELAVVAGTQVQSGAVLAVIVESPGGDSLGGELAERNT